MEILIVSKHPSVTQFIKDQAILGDDIRVISDPKPEDVSGNIVYGNLPLELAALCHLVIMVEYDADPPQDPDFTVDDMLDAGARLSACKVMTI